jgi:hypothetical protein
MSNTPIQYNDGILLTKKLLAESIPVVARLASLDGSETGLRGFVDSITFLNGLVGSAVKGSPSTSSHFKVPLPGNPIASECQFFYGDKREIEETKREELAERYGDAVLTIMLPSGSRLNLFLNQTSDAGSISAR